MKIVKIIQLKIVIFRTLKNCSLLHGRVFVMDKTLISLHGYAAQLCLCCILIIESLHLILYSVIYPIICYL